VPANAGIVERPDGRRLRWRSEGRTSAPAVLFIHGSSGSSRTAPSAKGARVVAYDRPGFGGSSPHPARTLQTDAADAVALLDALGLERAAVLAFSGGAAVGYALAVETPKRVARLGVASGAVWPVDPPPSREVLQAAARELRAAPSAVVARLAEDAPPDDAAALADTNTARRLRAGIMDAVGAGIDGWVVEAALVRAPWPFAPEDVGVETTLWHGSHDEAVPLAAAEAVAARLPHAALEVLPDAGHLGWLLRERELVEALAAG
jgi:pimeloyl-ACP methyl ester carboxylesterase